MFPGSPSLNISANLAKWHSLSTYELSRSFGYESTSVLAAVSSSSGDNVDRQPKQLNWSASSHKAYKIVGVGLQKQWTGRWNWRAEPSRCVSHTCIRTKSQFRRRVSWARNKVWRVWWETLCRWEAYGAPAPGSLKSGPAWPFSSHSLSFMLIKLMNPLQTSVEYEKWPTKIDLEYTPQKQRK